LRSPAFQRLWLGLSISYRGDQFTTFALLWFLLQLAGSGAAVRLVILCFDLGASTSSRLRSCLLAGLPSSAGLPTCTDQLDDFSRLMPTAKNSDRCSPQT
jgi:hypothetical protein